MSVCVPTAGGVSLALRSAEGAPSRRTSQSLSNMDDRDEPSSNTKRAADDANEPQVGDHPNSPAKSETNKRKRGDDDGSSSKEGKRLALQCASGHADDADAEFTSYGSWDSGFGHSEHGIFVSSTVDGRDGEPVNPNSDEGATSDFDDGSDADSTSSLDSKCLEFVHENGRWYHADVGNGYEYLMPNDELQNELLDISHAGWLRFDKGKLYSALIDNVQSVLDIGTGAGIWAIDVADEYPSDISPIQHTMVPPNLEFQLDDCNQGSTFGGEYFDLIHVRGMAGCISNCDAFAKRQFDDLKPGGYLEYKDLSMRFRSDDESLKDCNSLNEWGEFWKDVGTKLNRPLTIAEDGTVEKAMKRAGFTNIGSIVSA
ncbi:hypothetical protein CDV36_015648 [Fusarium kuroshium]|uniref:Methyltransferase domain-containing protein n=1 Tax=Fusarium kuroshium TaxID=2010991 RepID=A0A3M2R8P9_9HYPO|nr:hypothetical protein CDV36_015648 [Fusarium kuroshium]